MSHYSILDYGAVGDGDSNDAAAVQAAIDACHAGGGGRVVVPAGRTYVISQVNLKSHVELHLEAGATLTVKPMGDEWYPDRGVIHAFEQEHIAVTGLGVIDGRCKEWCETTEAPGYAPKAGLRRPHLIHPRCCENVVIQDITLRDAPYWTVTPSGCNNVGIHRISILNDLLMPNCDGIDPDSSSNVRISDCHIVAADDCICIKSAHYHVAPGVCENITVTGCTMVSTSCAIKIGSESIGDIRNVVFDSCVITGSNRGVGIQNRDAGVVENILFSNMIIETRLNEGGWWGKSEAIYVTSFPRRADGQEGRLRNVRFSNIVCKGENGLFFAGNEKNPLEGIVLENVRVEIDKFTDVPGGKYDERPGVNKGEYESINAGIHCEHVKDIALRNVSIGWGNNRPDYYGPALYARHVDTLQKDGFNGRSAHPDRFPDEDVQ